MTCRVLLPLVLAAAGCADDSRQRHLREEFNALAVQRQNLTTHEANLRAAADAELAGRPVTELPADSAARLAIYQQQYLAADQQLRAVDTRMSSIQTELSTPP